MGTNSELKRRITWHDNGRVSTEYYTHPDTNQCHGLYIQYNRNGTKSCTREYHNGKAHGTETKYYFSNYFSTRSVNTIAHFEHGKLHGLKIHHDINGTACVYEYYIKGHSVTERIYNLIQDIHNITNEERTILTLHGVSW